MMPDPQTRHSAILHAARHDLDVFSLRASPIVNGGPLMPNWHIEAICRALMDVVEGKTRRLLITMPPRCLKTYHASICLPAWMLGRNPGAKIICASYAASLSEQFSMDTRNLMQSAWYRRVFPATLVDPRRASREEFRTTAGGFRMASSVGGTLTGRGGDVVVIDDPLKAGDAMSEAARRGSIDWFDKTVHSRLNDPKTGAIIIVSQRLHAEDLPGHLLETGGWTHLNLPMEFRENTVIPLTGDRLVRIGAGALLHEERHGPAELRALRIGMGERDYEAQYNQNPEPPDGALFRRIWIVRYDELPSTDWFEGVYQSWDTAWDVQEQHDYSVCTTWGYRQGRYYLLDVYRAKLEFPALHHAVMAQRKKWRPVMVIVEAVGSGKALWQSIRSEYDDVRWLDKLTPQGSKQERAAGQTPKFERGQILLPREAPWLADFEKELFAFPWGKHDDQVDSAVQFLIAADKLNLEGRAGTIIRVR